MDHQVEFPSPNVLLFPLPLQGPLNCMLKLAELLCLSDIQVTFLNTHYIQQCLLRHTDIIYRFKQYPKFQFKEVSDGLADDHPRTVDKLADLINGMKEVTDTVFKDLLISGCPSYITTRCPVTVVIADAYYSLALDVAEENGVPLIYFETISPCALWTFLCLPQLIECGEVPFKDDDLDVGIKSVPGTGSFLRRRDLPRFCNGDMDLATQFAIKEGRAQQIRQIPRAKGLILNTFNDLDSLVLPHMQNVCPNIYSIGPIHTMLKSKLKLETPPPPPPSPLPTPPLPSPSPPPSPPPPSASSNSLWAEEISCISWLDTKPERSVIFVSIGSLATMTMDQLVEIWHGLVNSGQPFLWVRRPGSVKGDHEESEIEELLEGTRERGFIVGWAPQETVLAHPAIGVFFTHSGWNSTLESIVERVPMICWPYFLDQQVNSRFVSEVWKVGLDMKDSCDREIVEKMVRDVMDVRKDEFVKSADELAKMAAQSIAQGGSSYVNLERLIEDIKLIFLEKHFA